MLAADSERRIPELDLLRGFAITAVVGLHCGWFYTLPSELGGPAGRMVALLFLLSGFGVPLFLALSAAGLSLRYSSSTGVAGYLAFLRPRVVRLLPAYVLWSVVSAALFRDDAFTSLRTIATIFLRGSADAQYYFIPLLIEIYALWPVLRPPARLAARNPWWGLAVAGVGMALTVVWWNVNRMSYAPQGILMMPLFWLGYLTLGIAAAPHLKMLLRAAAGRRAIVVMSVATTVAAFAMYRNFLSQVEPRYDPTEILWAAIIFQIPPAAYTLCVIALLTLLAARLRATSISARVLNILGTHSYGIFLMHLIVVRLVLHRLLPPLALANDSVVLAVAKTLVCWFGALALTTAIVALLSRSAWTRPLVSNRW